MPCPHHTFMFNAPKLHWWQRRGPLLHRWAQKVTFTCTRCGVEASVLRTRGEIK